MCQKIAGRVWDIIIIDLKPNKNDEIMNGIG